MAQTLIYHMIIDVNGMKVATWYAQNYVYIGLLHTDRYLSSVSMLGAVFTYGYE